MLKTFNITTLKSPDKILTILFKECPLLYTQLSKIITLSFKQGKLLDDWKEAIITSIYKKEDKQITENHRPINLASIVRKVMKKGIAAEMIKVFIK